MIYEKLAVCGSRDFPIEKRDKIFKILDRFYEKYRPRWFISGFADGADKIIELDWAIPKGMCRMIFRPDYEKHQKGAPLVRNTEIIEVSDYVICIWNGKSRGTKDSIEKAKQKKKPLLVLDFDGNVIDKANIPE